MTLDHITKLLILYRRKGLLVDSNLLLLYFVGAYDPARIPTFKGTYTRGFNEDDFDLLVKLITRFERVVTTPNILTEVSNLSNQLRSDEKQSYHGEFARQTRSMTEHYTPTSEISTLQHFADFGLTDSGIIQLARGNFLVLTDDFKLAGYLQNKGIDAINFNHVRYWGS